ncbi:hypothetical protein D3C71_809180 [compost metagenome]
MKLEIFMKPDNLPQKIQFQVFIPWNLKRISGLVNRQQFLSGKNRNFYISVFDDRCNMNIIFAIRKINPFGANGCQFRLFYECTACFLDVRIVDADDIFKRNQKAGMKLIKLRLMNDYFVVIFLKIAQSS